MVCGITGNVDVVAGTLCTFLTVLSGNPTCSGVVPSLCVDFAGSLTSVDHLPLAVVTCLILEGVPAAETIVMGPTSHRAFLPDTMVLFHCRLKWMSRMVPEKSALCAFFITLLCGLISQRFVDGSQLARAMLLL